MFDPILVTLLKMRPHYSHSSRANATPSSGTSPLAPYKEAPPPPRAQVTLVGGRSALTTTPPLPPKQRRWVGRSFIQPRWFKAGSSICLVN